mmetsp:Transcript_11452/g.42747  ORF Transcript_11452/g.42747 Transcript_11452/m.42747 type:complete len:344 (+) Transcript_11452:355-1386(+)
MAPNLSMILLGATWTLELDVALLVLHIHAVLRRRLLVLVLGGGGRRGDRLQFRAEEVRRLRVVLEVDNVRERRQVELVDLRGGGDESAPGVVRLAHDLHGVAAMHALLVEAELVGRLAVGDLVRAEPLAHGRDRAREQALHVGHVVQLLRPAVRDIDDDDLPVGFAVVDHAETSQDLHLADRPRGDDAQPDFADVQRVVVAADAGVRVDVVGVLPGAGEAAVVEEDISLLELAEDALLHVLLDGVLRLVGGDLKLLAAVLRNLAHEVERSRGAVVHFVAVEQRHVVPEGDGDVGLLAGGLHAVRQGSLVSKRGERHAGVAPLLGQAQHRHGHLASSVFCSAPL